MIRNRIKELRHVLASDLRANPRNYRKHPPRQKALLKQLLSEVGYADALIAYESQGELILIDGHLRAETTPDQTVPVLVLDVTEQEAKKLLLTLDPLAAMAETDAAILGDLLKVTETSGEVDVWLKERAEEAGIVEAPPEEPAEIPPDRYAEVMGKWPVQPGEIWQLGRHRLLCGDSLLEASYTQLLAGDAPALVIADPPYGVSIVATSGFVGGGEAYKIPFGGKKGHVGGGESIRARTGSYAIESHKRKGLGTSHGPKPFGSNARGTDASARIVDVGKYAPIIGDGSTQTAKESLSLCLALNPEAVQVWWGANYYVESLTPSQCWLVWSKETTGNFADCELAWTNQDRAARLFTHRWNGLLRDSERDKRWHPTQKPAALASWVYSLLLKIPSIVLDPFGGAGWSLLAAETDGHSARVIEMSPEYCAVICERWHKQTGQTPERLHA